MRPRSNAAMTDTDRKERFMRPRSNTAMTDTYRKERSKMTAPTHSAPPTRARPKIDRPILVEGKYDKITLTALFDATVLTTGGFAIFNNKEKQALLRRIASERGLLVLTDSDGGGKQIRSFLSTILDKSKVTMLYIPKIEGKEKRKAHASKSGTLGVEGMSRDVLTRILAPYFSDAAPRCASARPITKIDFYNDGLTGQEGSTDRRRALATALSLPDDMTANALLEAVNLLCDYDAYRAALDTITTAAP